MNTFIIENIVAKLQTRGNMILQLGTSQLALAWIL
jgi:hypothetical protein